MSDVKQVASQLRSLAAEPENREYIVHDQTCFSGIVKFLENPDHEVVTIALEALRFLTLRPENRPQMAKATTLSSSLKRLMMDFTVPLPCKQMAGNIYGTLQKYFDCGSIEAATNDAQAAAYSTPTKETAVPPRTPVAGLSSFSERVSFSISSAKTFTFYVKNLTEVVKPKLEAKLLATQGVISFIIDVSKRRATIRSSKPAGDMISVFKGVNLTALLVADDFQGSPIQDKENDPNAPQYLPEPSSSNSNSGGWFSSIVKWGAPVEDRTQKRKSQAPTSSGFMSRLYNVGESLWT